MKPLRVLVVCTANACRSPVVEHLFAMQLDAHGIESSVTSAGTAGGPTPVHSNTAIAAREVGIDLSQHDPRLLTGDIVDRDGRDLIVTMTREHLYRVVELSESAFHHAFTLAELAGYAERLGPNPLSFDVGSWLASLDAQRTPQRVAAEGPTLDVNDPYGRPRRFHRQMIDEVTGHVGKVVSTLAASVDLSR